MKTLSRFTSAVLVLILVLAMSVSVFATDEEITHALLLVIPSCGFPIFMEAYNEFKND